MADPQTHRASRKIAASPEVLYWALLDPDALETWLAPQGAHLLVEKLDAQPGGAFRFVLTFDAYKGKSGANKDVISGHFVALTPGELVLSESDFTTDDPDFEGTMHTGWHFSPVPGGTRVEVVAENVPPGISKQDHEAGFAASLANLARYAEQN
ncbi:SRPBCC domain-containing protein [Maritimibacter sp. HL-12]|jgi:uncharacterized protein YndB with AHSA1/START domain|uniref:SRPBCC domain-containing protein n=1 Tax=Maritimibacter sp. HL-12 TaxID=1162418 RepID=UPI000A0EFF29|nr:SRPBCC domain-containing protein [Maritimibacter sp. HL-12]SMH51448.1 Uncharacterized conserved protein YndB, AHSA1/START domain [Maritimibacter sp. HL-12]